VPDFAKKHLVEDEAARKTLAVADPVAATTERAVWRGRPDARPCSSTRTLRRKKLPGSSPDADAGYGFANGGASASSNTQSLPARPQLQQTNCRDLQHRN
jgi:hypothetical protein